MSTAEHSAGSVTTPVRGGQTAAPPVQHGWTDRHACVFALGDYPAHAFLYESGRFRAVSGVRQLPSSHSHTKSVTGQQVGEGADMSIEWLAVSPRLTGDTIVLTARQCRVPVKRLESVGLPADITPGRPAPSRTVEDAVARVRPPSAVQPGAWRGSCRPSSGTAHDRL